MAAAAAALWIAPACDGTSPFFESTNLDPHPPEIRNLRVEQANLGLFVTLQRLTFSYFDAGADIEEVEFIDLGIGSVQAENIVEPVEVNPLIFLDPDGEEGELVEPTAVAFFPDTEGRIQMFGALGSGLVGRHVIKMFLVDSKETRSEPIYFYIDLPDPR